MAAERHNVSRRAVLGAGAAAAAVAVTGPGAAAPEPAAAPLAPPAPRPGRLHGPRIDIVCGRCGGDNVMRDAWAIWDADEQDWVLGAVFDYGHCDDCGGESRLEEVALPAA